MPQIENGYIVKDDQDNGFYIEPHGYLDENLNKQILDAVITPTKNLELPIVGSFVKGADVIPKLINKFNPKYILSSTIGGDAKYSGFLNNFISVLPLRAIFFVPSWIILVWIWVRLISSF